MDMKARPRLTVRQLRENELTAADRILRGAFDRFTGITNLFADKDYLRTRWRAAPDRAIAAEANGRLAGSNIITLWGSLGFFGPLSVDTALWDQGIAKGLMETTIDVLTAARVRHAALFTFAHSPRHQGLYQRFGFWPRYLTPILQRPVSLSANLSGLSRFSQLEERERLAALQECRQITDALYEGLDVTSEIKAVLEQNLGDTVLLQGQRLDGFAVCHAGPGTEAGSGLCYVKFGALRPDLDEKHFDRLIDACDALAASLGATQLELGVNMACHEAYRRLCERGFRAGLIGVAMDRPNEPAYNRAGVFALSDWR
ncbi:GNAT family N-acetyltransferase [Ramlibacter sp. AW1]|uniref:GNAT family N-acetyltransferase n=1 Tax=Ramlibacter aurantiacus TaxID=2801330 RepID=A0A936ZJ57_9BURK|nr:GNAT family N-acetyltransferase [Ramlibacter aurantiacus]MBL0421872.1 GNAT family N-acetyltransferase [Ramlibacter aurantiacus]